MSMPGTDPVTSALRVAIVGAESTGKSELAHALAEALAREFDLRCDVVDEYLRTWCDEHGRTPRADEQLGIALEHARRIATAATQPDVDVVLCDTTPLMVAVYSDLLFDDRSLEPVAVACQRAMDVTLLTSLDLPWVADGHQRDGPHVRGPVVERMGLVVVGRVRSRVSASDERAGRTQADVCQASAASKTSGPVQPLVSEPSGPTRAGVDLRSLRRTAVRASDIATLSRR
jgi:nicotinamide riboside kinase